MKTSSVSIDFSKMRQAFRKHVRKKAVDANNTIIYLKQGKLIEEDPGTTKTKVILEKVRVAI